MPELGRVWEKVKPILRIPTARGQLECRSAHIGSGAEIGSRREPLERESDGNGDEHDRNVYGHSHLEDRV